VIEIARTTRSGHRADPRILGGGHDDTAPLEREAEDADRCEPARGEEVDFAFARSARPGKPMVGRATAAAPK